MKLRGKIGATETKTERAHRALDLRIAGMRYRQIGQQLGISTKTAYVDVQDALEDVAELTKDRAEKLREIELERCEKMTLALWSSVGKCGEKAVRALVAIMDRRAKLAGLDMPTKTALTDPSGEHAYTGIVRTIVEPPPKP